MRVQHDNMDTRTRFWGLSSFGLDGRSEGRTVGRTNNRLPSERTNGRSVRRTNRRTVGRYTRACCMVPKVHTWQHLPAPPSQQVCAEAGANVHVGRPLCKISSQPVHVHVGRNATGKMGSQPSVPLSRPAVKPQVPPSRPAVKQEPVEEVSLIDDFQEPTKPNAQSSSSSSAAPSVQPPTKAKAAAVTVQAVPKPKFVVVKVQETGEVIRMLIPTNKLPGAKATTSKCAKGGTALAPPPKVTTTRTMVMPLNATVAEMRDVFSGKVPFKVVPKRKAVKATSSKAKFGNPMQPPKPPPAHLLTGNRIT